MKRGRSKSYLYPVVLVFKTSNRSNAKTKIKIYKTIDEIIDQLEESILPGFPKGGKVLDLGIGKSFIDKFKIKHKL